MDLERVPRCLGACLSNPRGRDRDRFRFSRGGADEVGLHPMRRRQRRLKRNLSGPVGLAGRGASAALRGLTVEPATAGAVRLASAPSPSQRGSRGLLRQAPSDRHSVERHSKAGLITRKRHGAVPEIRWEQH
jgi:hypothetical protein